MGCLISGKKIFVHVCKASKAHYIKPSLKVNILYAQVTSAGLTKKITGLWQAYGMILYLKMFLYQKSDGDLKHYFDISQQIIITLKVIHNLVTFHK